MSSASISGMRIVFRVMSSNKCPVICAKAETAPPLKFLSITGPRNALYRCLCLSERLGLHQHEGRAGPGIVAHINAALVAQDPALDEG
jgi:hypothetical protein